MLKNVDQNPLASNAPRIHATMNKIDIIESVKYLMLHLQIVLSIQALTGLRQTT